MAARIIAVSYHLPQKVETNEDLKKENPEWKMADVYNKTGIASRHIAGKHETASDLGYIAAADLLQRTSVDICEIDYLIYCTQSPDFFLPSTACILQHRLGLGTHVAAFDLNLGCSGFIYGLRIASSLVSCKAARNVLLITSDTYSKFIHPRDRSVRTVFGDAAAATLIGPAKKEKHQIGHFVLGTDGSGAEKLIVPSGGLRVPHTPETALHYTDDAGCTRSKDNLFMDGPAIFTFAISRVPIAIKNLLQNAGMCLDDIDWFIYHQANRYMLEQLAKQSKIPPEKVVMNFEDIGNTVSSSIPIALQRMIEDGKITEGHRLALIGFGVGYSWGACELLW